MSIDAFSLLEQDLHPRILLVGDVMLDRYLFGDVERISPEAPIPVLRIGKQEHRLGGASSVASMVAMLGAKTILAAVVGDDAEGRTVRDLLEKIGVDTRCVLTVGDRCTTVKERLLGRAQQRYPHQMMRVDREVDRPIEADQAEALLDGMARCIGDVDLVLVSDYNKGVCKGEMIPRVVAMARAAGVPVIADPVKKADYRRYAGCACITPNRLEAATATGITISTPQDGLEAARRLLQFGVDSAIVTLDRDGMAWADRSGGAGRVAARPRQVCDITGAGDMVLATLGYALAAGADSATAIEIANTAGGLEVERLGVVPLTRAEILTELGHRSNATAHKILPIDQVEAHVRRLRQAGQRIVMTNGCFDLLHPGHVASLQESRRHGDCLLVGLNSDRSIRELKGMGRPIVDQQGRAEMLAALACVDYVVIFDEASVAGLVERVAPDVLVKGGEYAVEEVVGYDVVLRNGGRVLPVLMKACYSTTALIEKIRNLPLRKRSAA
jgi:D-beta-D-heptose 7-phosphate kinase / D-beta-D-heptose 1-phosphate adenosyltransferase